MLSKQSEDFLTKLRVELQFRGKKSNDIEEIEDELRDHLEIAEQNEDDVSHIIDTPIKVYADQFAKNMPFFNHISKYITYFIVFMIVVFTLPDFFAPTYTLTVSYILNVIFIFFITIVVGLYLMREIILKFGDNKITYILSALCGIFIFGLMVLSHYLARHFPIYDIVTLNQSQSVILGSLLFIIIALLCFLLKQKIFIVVLFIVCLPNIIALIFSDNGSNSQYIMISLTLLIVFNIGFTVFIFYQIYKDKKLEKQDSKQTGS
ncbi:hypothetical protein DOS77_01730 [Staphylococcus felis]|uniref:hypothetical protein n=1 Tax=Staphylococcus felis TaxID=46127 RepID=UPI000E25903B|nr:hypothetical protein [Staphylococcus felis]REH79193.1 hypothetical protein DOS57_03500 [Staphylococcus felis]REH99213.1 hypothetical protein DOS67_00055 [Staphylococcus felis]REI03444.1 hypothetical protein DOS62_08295 [Staphylococcus felis]REI09316.1 hypothetical protein DOS69_02275 [Staphylococcus felis]REI10324.1 hypothetical protein DOS71_06145 [Staphylococcus felis]